MEKALEVTVNGLHPQTVGLGHPVGVVHVIVEIHGGILNLLLQASDAVSGELIWWDAPRIAVGDEIRVKVVEGGAPSPEQKRWQKRSIASPAEGKHDA